MEDLKRIKTMVSLAVYDKHYGEKDRKITSKYRRDYVYLRGLSMRIGVAMGFFIICGMYYLYELVIKNADIFEMISKNTIIEIGVALLAILIIYTFICSFTYKREYEEAQGRLDIYEERLKRLNVSGGLKGKKISVKGKENGRVISDSSKTDRDL